VSIGHSVTRHYIWQLKLIKHWLKVWWIGGFYVSYGNCCNVQYLFLLYPTSNGIDMMRMGQSIKIFVQKWTTILMNYWFLRKDHEQFNPLRSIVLVAHPQAPWWTQLRVQRWRQQKEKELGCDSWLVVLSG
jgi:hypothetical protein